MPLTARPVRQAVASAAQIAAQTAGGLIATALAARALGPSAMGSYSLLVFVQAIVTSLAAAGWTAAMTRFVSESASQPDSARQAFRCALGRAARNAAGLTLITLVVAICLPVAVRLDILAMAAGLLPASLLALLQAAQQALQRFDRLAKAGVAGSLLLVGGTWAIVRSAPSSAAL
ncbi:MAG: hypothetical protein KGR26_01430, partial [Cyanobacteria bacterium REEB65]|nr:hypothetical protein [Cyanobacteria bacterium REEB65]